MENKVETEIHSLSLQEEATHLLEEARMLIPGIQAIFGFQLIAVFSEGFAQKLEDHHEKIHLLAMMLVLISMALVMSPAVYQRRVEPRKISAHFIQLASKMLTWGFRALTVGLTADIGVITYAVTEKESAAVMMSAFALAILTWLWFLLGSPSKYTAGSKFISFMNKHFKKAGSVIMTHGQKHYTRYKTELLNAGYKYLN